MSSLQQVLGVTEVQGKSGTVPVASLSGKYVLLYFSAHWCPPCRDFTPRLAEWYKTQHAARGDFELIFVSWDRSDEQFDGYYATMPWLALPRAANQNDRLNRLFKVEGIPTLVVVDKDGHTVITTEARGEVLANPTGLPWKPQSFDEIMSGPLLVKHGGATTTWKDLSANHDHVAIYFSAHWCPPCRQFTPHLAELYTKQVAAAGSTRASPAIIYASRDKTSEQFDEYYHTMPWHALPYNDVRVASLARKFKLQGIPTLVTIKVADGSVVNADAVTVARSDKDGSLWPFAKQPFPRSREFLADEVTVGPLQEGDVVVVLDTKSASAAEEQAARALFQTVADDLYPEFGDNGASEIKVRCMFTVERPAAAKLTEEQVAQCPAGHPLSQATRRSARCDVCGEGVQDTCHNCSKCDFDRCNNCFASRRAPQPQTLGLLSQVERVSSVGPTDLPASLLVMRGRSGKRLPVAAGASASEITAAIRAFVAAS